MECKRERLTVNNYFYTTAVFLGYDMSQIYSQNDEQPIIMGHLGSTVGRLLDIGAYVPTTFSNTRALLDTGWSGVLVEPSPEPFKALLDYYGDNPRVQLLNSAITSERKLLQFHNSNGDAVSTTQLDHKQRWEAGSPIRFKSYWLQSLAIDELFEHFGRDYTFISLDVESANWELFQRLPFTQLNSLKVLCVEHDGHHVAMANIAKVHGFQQIGFNGENLILGR